VHDAPLVRRRQRVGQRDRQLEQTRHGKAARAHEPAQVAALDQLHGEEPDAFLLLDRVEHHDVRVVEPRDRAGLALEPREPVRLARHCARQRLDGDLASQARVGGAKHLAHAARAEERDDPVGPETAAGRERHRGTMAQSGGDSRSVVRAAGRAVGGRSDGTPARTRHINRAVRGDTKA